MAGRKKSIKTNRKKVWKVILGHLPRFIKRVGKNLDKGLAESKKIIKKLTKLRRSEFKFELLLDKPLPADKRADIRFGHEQIAETIAGLVRKANAPFTIGLFGKWGTGKTTIIGLTKACLANMGIKTVTFDAWKYKDDSLRRQFLITLDKELGLSLKYKKILNQNLTKPSPLSLSLLIKQIVNIATSLLVVGLLIVSLLILFKRLNTSLDQTLIDLVTRDLVDGAFKLAGISLFFNLVLNIINKFMETDYGTIEESRTDSAEGFEDRFYNEVLPAIEEEKVLIVIDNLDRTSSDTATKLLSDIKTFLAKDTDYSRRGADNKAIFLIACDDVAIKKHLEKSKYDNPEEFLRKFFNCSLRIPMFLDVELDRYTEELIGQTKVKKFIENRQLIWLITYSFRGNPREIKQFINTLTAQHLLANNMQKSGNVVRTKEITNNVEFLAKILIVRQKYPNIFNNIEEKSLRLGLEWKEIERDIHQVLLIGDEEENTNFERFVDETKQVKEGYLPLFIRLRQSEDEQKLGAWSAFTLAAIDKQIEDAGKIFAKIKDDEDLTMFDELAKDLVVKERRKSDIGSGTDRLLSFGSTIIKVAGSRLPLLDNFLREFVSKIPKQNNLLTRIDDFSPTLYFENVYPLLSDTNKERLVETYLSLFGLESDGGKSSVSPEIVKEIFSIIVKHQKYFDKKVGEIQTAIEKYFWDFQYLELFVSKKLIGKYITKKAKENYIKSVGVEDLTNLEILDNKLRLLNDLL